jgi:hypothetical protein
MSNDNDEKLDILWKEVQTTLTDLNVALIKLRNHMGYSPLKKEIVTNIDSIRHQINRLELGLRGQ